MSPHAISPLGVILGMHLMTNDSTVLEVNDLVKVYKVRSAEKHADHKALDGVTFRLSRGGSLAVVGESGSGKSTCARIIVGLERATSGTVLIDGALMGSAASRRSSRERARRVQMVFQDPYSSLIRCNGSATPSPRSSASTAAALKVSCGSVCAILCNSWA